MFDTVNGLPLHPLVVHAVVVLLPLAALLTIAVAVRSAWRRHAALVVAADAVVLALTWVATQSGERLQARLEQLSGAGVAREHAADGGLLPWFALALLAAAVLVWVARDRPALVPVSVAASAVTGVAAVAWVVITGESGAEAVWRDLISNTTAP